MIISRLLTGAFSIIAGASMIIISLIVADKSLFVMWLFGLPLIVIGIVLLMNKNEDVIEQINYNKMKGGKK